MSRSVLPVLSRLLLVLVLASACALPRAWDAQRMLDAAQRSGAGAPAGVRSLHALLGRLVDVDERGRLTAVNAFFNQRIVFEDDRAVWGVEDYWASPVETLGRGRGDCEDFAMAKYFTLVAAGVPQSRLRLVYVRATIGGPGGVVQPHMVLAWYAQPDAEPLILDNLVGELRPASRRPDLLPVFSFNGEGLWDGAGPARTGDAVARLSRWREVLAKAGAEGFL